MGPLSTFYKIDEIDQERSYYKCSVVDEEASGTLADALYLTFAQLLFVGNLPPPTQSQSVYSLSTAEDAASELEHLRSILPYFTDFTQRQEKSVLNQNDFADDPSGYLRAILKKYNIRHPRHIAESEETQSGDYTELRPWIEGKMEKLMAQKGYALLLLLRNVAPCLHFRICTFSEFLCKDN